MQLSCPAPYAFQANLSRSPHTQVAVDWPIQVLLVEDNEEAAWLVRIYLTENQHGQFRVEWTQNLLQAMERLAQPGVEIVLLDLGLPELNGYRTFRAVEAATGGKVPIVILTSDDRALSRELTMGFGASEYLLKHRMSPDQLRQAILEAIQHGHPKALE